MQRIKNYPSAINMSGNSPQDRSVTKEKYLEKCCVCGRERGTSRAGL